ncbi:MAG: motility protein A [Chloroflexi bacterium]|jgi:chemotaxis protein MotA|nr:motility protein A [Chloroflexota bacterium]
MDLATIFGFIAAIVIIIIVMILDGGSPLELFAHPSAIILIIGGSLAATTISSPLSLITRLPKLVMLAFQDHKYNSMEAIDLLSKMADKARREGLLALEEESKKIKDPFLQKGIMLVVDGVDPSQVKAIMENTIENMHSRHRAGYGMFSAAGGFAPTFGIIGTVMGLISVLQQLDDPNKLAKSIAGAFLATLWGLLSANLIYLPLAGKLRANDDMETAYRYLLMEGVLALQAGENPRIVREKLMAYLPPNVSGKEKAATPKDKKAPQKAKAES